MIVQRDSKILREIAKPVPVSEIKSKKIAGIIQDMKEALASQIDGVALAAPQIGVSLRIFVVSGKILGRYIKRKKGEEERPEKEKRADLPDMVFINPEILKASKDSVIAEEGCLSIRYAYGKMIRAKKATVRAYDEHGKLFERGASGLLAQIFQHETDHLDGRLFTDKAFDVEEIPPEKYAEYLKNGYEREVNQTAK